MKKYRLTYPTQETKEPVLAQVILATKVPLNILWARVDFDEGELVISLPEGTSREKEVISYFKKRGVTVESFRKTIHKNKRACTDCGVCVGVCPTDAICLDKEHVMYIDKEACVLCGACVEACPLRAISINE